MHTAYTVQVKLDTKFQVKQDYVAGGRTNERG